MGLDFHHKPSAKHTAVHRQQGDAGGRTHCYFISSSLQEQLEAKPLPGSKGAVVAQVPKAGSPVLCLGAYPWFLKMDLESLPAPCYCNQHLLACGTAGPKPSPWLSAVTTAAPGAARWLVPSMKSQVSNSCCHTNSLGKLRNHGSSGP